MSRSNSQAAARLREAAIESLREFQPDPASDMPQAIQKAIHVARRLQRRAKELQTPQERRQQTELDRMIQNPHDRATLTQLTDQAFRSRVAHRVADQLIHILDVQGVPRFFSPIDRTLLKGFQSFGGYLPGVAVPLVKEKMHQETANVILPAESELLAQHLQERRKEGLRMNVNFLGEALLGEEEAESRLRRYLQALQEPAIEVISVKISTIFSQISSVAWEDTVDTLCDRMELLYRAAAKARFRRADGSEVPKFVYLDMEEYRDMRLTADVFMQTLSRPGLEKVAAGMALQAYIPDSYEVQCEVQAWARERVAEGGAPITLRIVKGANMEMERVEASLRGWPQAPFKQKRETDANYKRMLLEGMKPENADAVRLGVATHNLFDMAYGLVLAFERDCLVRVQFEMLEGMANHQRRALNEWCDDLLLYAPACRHEDFVHAIGYLIRRLDENTGPENFLRHAFRLDVDSEDWKRLEAVFVESFQDLDDVPRPRRTQDRRRSAESSEPIASPAGQAFGDSFQNEPDTDFALPANVDWGKQILDAWRDRCDAQATQVPAVIDGRERFDGEPSLSHDPSRPGVVVARFQPAGESDLGAAVECAERDPQGWRKMSVDERSRLLGAAAQEIRKARATLMGAALAEGGKILLESDPEVSEAVDFVEFYSRSARFFQEMGTVQSSAKGVVVVVSPWNFPIAIPCGGVAAALAAGNTVILKPASDTVLVAYELCRCFWRAGISKQTLQFAPCPGSRAGKFLIGRPEVDAVILTGGTETARTMLAHHPHMNLLAETGGKNATIVTALSDRDQAVKHVLHSAFSHSGQKCSATSLLILEEEVYEDRQFRATLEDAVASIPVGSAWEPTTRLGPLIRPPSGDLETGLKELEEHESWAVIPRHVGDNPHLYSPGVKWNVQAGSYTHMTEFFGPLLGVMRAKNLDHAIQMTNQTGYGLTSGLESLDDREQEYWTERIRAGNLYVNRSTTGAIVLRQPFGGLGKSAFGPGIKAGGPNYVAQLMDFRDVPIESRVPVAASSSEQDEPETQLAELVDQIASCPIEPEEASRVLRAVAAYQQSYRAEFEPRHDHFLLIGQDNLRLYQPVRELRIRLHPDDSPFDILTRVCAARTVGCRITVSQPADVHAELVHWLDEQTESWGAAIEFVEETDRELAAVLSRHDTDRLRFGGPGRLPDPVARALADSGIYAAQAPVLVEGRIELLWYVQEQSLSSDYHRYGNLGQRALEPRTEPA